MTEPIPRHHVTRIRRETRRRALTVTAAHRLAPHMLRLEFASPDLHDFESAAPDDHVKLFLPGVAGDGERPAMRDYTPRSVDTSAGTLTIDFALHEAGPATAWASGAKIGDTIAIGGPRGSAVVADDFGWYLLIGDETALPSICRRVEELRAEARITVLLVADSAADQVPLPDRAGLTARWTFRDQDGNDAARLIALIDPAAMMATGEGYVWIAGESNSARTLRAHVVDTLGHPRGWTKAAGYWTLGVADAHERIEQ